MKAERRHELRENDLLHMLESARDYLTENGSRLAIGGIVAVALVIAVSFGLRSRAAAYEDIWRQKSQLSFEDAEKGRKSLDSLASLAAGTSDSTFVMASLIEQGRQSLRLAVDVPFGPDKEFNEKARAAFEDLRRRFPSNPMAVGLAGLGLATVEENAYLLDHNPDHKAKAESLLNGIIQNPILNGMPVHGMAIDRLKSLDRVFAPVVVVPPPVPQPAAEAAPVDPAVDAEPAVDTP